MLRHLLRFGIRQKVVLILLATLVVGLTASTWLALRSQTADILNETTRRGNEVGHFVARTLAYSVVAYDYHTIELLLRELASHDDVVYARVTSPKGNVMAEIGVDNPERLGITPSRQDIRLNNEIVGQLHLGLGTDRIAATLEKQKQDSILRQLLVIFGVLAVELAALSYIIVRPLNIMSRAMRDEAQAGQNTAPNIPLATRDEFGEIATQFNALHARLNEAREKLQSRVEYANVELQHAYEQLTTQADELKRKNVDLELLAITDPLTGLYNKRYFEMLMENEVGRSVSQSQICSIVLIDLDFFKSINERYGHSTGDNILRQVARLLAQRVRKTDVLCRFGGDEFFLLCRQATMGNAMNVAEQLHEAVTHEPLMVDDQPIPVGLSIGIATIPSPRPMRTAAEFFECADAALAHSKRSGRNTIVHFSRMPADQTATRG